MEGKLTTKEVSHIARLANLPVTTTETSQFQKQLSDVVEYVGKIEKVHSVQGTLHKAAGAKVVRKDEIQEERCLTQEEATSNAKNLHNGLFVAPHVFGDRSNEGGA